jgi:predicted Zn-dependent protease
MRKEYEDELKALKLKMQKAERFAEKIPCLSKTILENKFTGEEGVLHFGSKYKDIYLAWDINRYFYKNGKNITNYHGDVCDIYLFNIYINTLTLYNRHENFGIYEAMKDVKIFFTDHLNTTFYVTDENIGDFLEAINSWYLKAREDAKVLAKQERINKTVVKTVLIRKHSDVFKACGNFVFYFLKQDLVKRI